MTNKVVIVVGRSGMSSLRVTDALATLMVDVTSRDYAVSVENPKAVEFAWMTTGLDSINIGDNPTPRGPKPRKRW